MSRVAVGKSGRIMIGLNQTLATFRIINLVVRFQKLVHKTVHIFRNAVRLGFGQFLANSKIESNFVGQILIVLE